MPRAALFDMDRTLVRRETASLYVRYQREIGEANARDTLQVAWWVLQYTVGVIDVTNVAERALRKLRGTHENVLAARCDDWYRRWVEVHVADRAREVVAEHLAAGDVCAIVTGATPYAARPLAGALRIPHVVASELERDAQGMFTGLPEYPLCYGVGKVARASRLAARLGFALRDAVFYTDSITDLPLLEAVAEPVCVNPDPRLKRIAKKRGWRIEAW
jgi:HAD superfamily hydrolase (TIGR01490 family)